jgi:K+-sensing histidine kinase KdpD
MKRFGTATHPAMYWAIAIAMAVVFAIDLQTRIGVATWILYVVPLVLCFRVTQAWLPFVVASICTVLVLIDWFASPAGITGDIAQINRGMGLVVMWVAAAMAYNNIILRHRLRRDDWTRTARARIGEAVMGEH